PALAATLTICIVFFPVVLLYGPAKFLFTPLALSVVFAMLASYLLSRTLVPTLARMLMEKEALGQRRRGLWARLNEARDRGFERLLRVYDATLGAALGQRGEVLVAAAALVAVAITLPKTIGTDFF